MNDLNLDETEQTVIDEENTAFTGEDDGGGGKKEEAEQKPDEQEQKDLNDAIEASKKLDEKIEDDAAGEGEPEEKTDKTDDGKDSTGKKSDKKGEEDDTTKKANDDKKTTDEKEEQKADDGTHVISDDLVERAVRQGYTMSAARSFGSAEVLKTTLELLESKSVDTGKQTQEQKTGKDTKTVEELKFEALEIKFENEKDLDPEVVEQIKAVNEANTKNFEQLTKVVNELRTQVADQGTSSDKAEVDSIMAEIDGMYGELGNDKDTGTFYKEALGEGLTANIAKGSPQEAKRKEVISAMRAIDIVDADNKVSKTTKDLFSAGLKQVFSDKQVEITNKKVAKTVTDRNKQTINNPGGSKKAAQTGDEAAIQSSKDFDKLVDDSDD